MPAESPLRWGPLRGSGPTAAPGPPLSRGKRRGAWRSRKNSKGAWFGADLSHRFPGEGRDPGTTKPWVAASRRSTRRDLRGTERAVFSRKPEHYASREPAALRSAPWQRHHRGSWAPAFAGETKGSVEEPEKLERGLLWRRSLSSFSRRRPGSRGHRTLGGSQKDIDPPRPPRHRACCLFKKARALC